MCVCLKCTILLPAVRLSTPAHVCLCVLVCAMPTNHYTYVFLWNVCGFLCIFGAYVSSTYAPVFDVSNLMNPCACTILWPICCCSLSAKSRDEMQSITLLFSIYIKRLITLIRHSNRWQNDSRLILNASKSHVFIIKRLRAYRFRISNNDKFAR